MSKPRNRRLSSLRAPALAALIAIGLAAPAPAQFPIFGPPKLLFENEDAEGSTIYPLNLKTNSTGVWIATFFDLESNTVATNSVALSSRSTDDGETWSELAPMFSTEWNAQPGFEYATLVPLGGGEWLASVGSSRPAGVADVLAARRMFSRSLDDGATWSDPVPFAEVEAVAPGVNTIAGFDLRSDGEGTLLAAWIVAPHHATTPPELYETEFYTSRSFDGGATWETPALLAKSTRKDSNCLIAPAGGGRWMLAWEGRDPALSFESGYDNDIFSSLSTDNGATWEPAIFVNTTAEIDGVTFDNLYRLESDGTEWMAIWSSILAFEPENEGRDAEVLVAKSSGGGAAWGATAKAQSRWRTDSLNDFPSSIHPLGGGRWFATWYSSKHYANPEYPDSEWTMASSVDDGATWSEPFGYGALPPDGARAAWTHRLVRAGDRWVAIWQTSDENDIVSIYYALGSSSQAGENATGVAVK